MSSRYALITVSDKTGIETLACGLEKLGFTILSTSNTARYLREHCSRVVEVSDITGFPEILDGRVKTLHPFIHAGILADRDKPEHLQKLEELAIERIDVVAVNLYPFHKTRTSPGATEAEIIENIDIGGPSLIRAAAKNHRHVLVLTDPADYSEVLSQLGSADKVTMELRKKLAQKAFSMTAEYDADIRSYFALSNSDEAEQLPSACTLYAPLQESLRYGENPHQKAGLYLDTELGWKVVHGKELSYNNYLDIDSSFRALRLFTLPTVVITKHCNPCGIGSAESLADAYRKALAADIASPYGGIVAVNRTLDMSTAELINQVFTEIIIAPGYEDGVLEYLQKKQNRRLIVFEPCIALNPASTWETRRLMRGCLMQEWDMVQDNPETWKTVTQRIPSESELQALHFGWRVVSLLRSNAIALTGEDCVMGLGSGQTSRIDSSALAIKKALHFGHDLSQAVCASDGFFPFRDSIEELHKHGIRAVIQPGGSKGDPEVIAACDEFGIAMVFTGVRHFRH